MTFQNPRQPRFQAPREHREPPKDRPGETLTERQLPQVQYVPRSSGEQTVQYVIMPHPTYWGQPPQLPGPPRVPEHVRVEQERKERSKRNLWLLFGFLSLLSVALLWYGLNRGAIVATPATSETILPDAPPVLNTEPAGPLLIDSIVRPARQANLSLPVGGIIKEINVFEGDTVEAGQILLSLDNSRQVVAVAQAQATLDQARSRLEALQSGEKNQSIVAAEAAVDAAQARLNNLTTGVRAEDESAAVAKLEAAQAALADLKNGPDDSVITEAQAELQTAESALRRAQNAYNGVKWRNDIAMLPESQNLEDATIDYERAKARFEQASQGADASEISEAQARVSVAEAELERVRNPVSQSEIDAASADLRQAQANLELVKQSAGSNLLIAAETDVSNAQVAALEAEVALEETRLTAPFAGIIGELNVQLGEFIESGHPSIQIGDPAKWQIVADKASEAEVANLAQGQTVTVTVVAIPDIALIGTVTRIRQSDAVFNGVNPYSVVIDLGENNLQLTWNMAAKIEVALEPEQ